ncbi:MAG: restriction endonuclease [Desulfuromonadaceae bacterium GWC2_58_13]|nr:MAG: restriction endonuclease [Desulfuromonadaceae bacterium GWC2_58_13]
MTDSNDLKADQLIAQMRKEEQIRQAGYREKALKLFPHVCGRCTREFEGKKLRELTVHHRDHNHDNNPPDGSNWELLCLYCHDHEHTRGIQEQRCMDTPAERQDKPSLAHSPFAALGDRFKKS